MQGVFLIKKIALVVSVSATVIFGQTFTGRVGASHDGNQHDRDDIGATAYEIGILAKAGAQLVHIDFNNHLATSSDPNDASMTSDQTASVIGAAQRWYGTTSMCYNDQTNLQGAINNIAAQINKSTATDRFYLICAGPMEVAWRGINASDPAKRQYCTAISHSNWNDGHTNSTMTHTWSSIQGSGVNAVHIADQNALLNCSSASCWDWSKNSTDEKIRFMYNTMANDGVFGDISDAGMTWYVITGRGDQACTPAKLQNFFGSGTPPPPNQPPVASFTSPVNGASFTAPASFSVTVGASDPNGSISNVKLYKNGTLVRQENTVPYQWNNTNQDAALQNLANGTYVLRADATDNLGAVTSASITITVGSGSSGGTTITLQAESFSSQSGIQTESCSEGGQNIGFIENGDYIVFNNVNLGTGATTFNARVASTTSGGSIEVRLGSLTGTLVGTCAVTGTGGWQTWTTKSCALTGASGVQNVYLKFTGGSGYLFNVNWASFAGTGLPKFLTHTQKVAIDPVFKILAVNGESISFNLPQKGNFALSFYDMSGARIAAIAQGGEAGVNLFSFQSAKTAPGMYIMNLEFEGKGISQRVRMVK